MIDTYVPPSQRPHKRRYTCKICGTQRVIEIRQIEKAVVVCLHPDSRGGSLPEIQRLEEGELV